MREERKKLERIAKAMYVTECDDTRLHSSDQWLDIIIEAGLGIDSRTARSYYRLCRVRGLIKEIKKDAWTRGASLSQYGPVDNPSPSGGSEE